MRAELREAIDGLIPTLWEPLETFEWSESESSFEELDPPPEWRVPDAVVESGDPTSALRAHLESVPLRWRLDVAMAFMLYVTLDAEED